MEPGAISWIKRNAAALFFGAAMVLVTAIVISCSGTSKIAVNNGMATISVSISDPPSCTPPNGSFTHVFITVRSVMAHTSATADASSSGWQELAPQLNSAPTQIDLFASAPGPSSCVLAQLGSAQLPAGTYQQIRLILLTNTPATGDAVPASNACAGNGFNCVVTSDGMIHELLLSSQDQTGLKIPPGQFVGGPLTVAAGQSVDLNIDFNACASILQEGKSGQFRLKPVLTAGQVSANNSGISGQAVDSATMKPIAGPVLVAIEQPDTTGVDRILMQTAADANGNFRFCPLPAGTFDIVAVAIGPANLPYNATAVLNVPNGASLGAIPLVAETGATGPAVLQGFVTATTGPAAASVDVSLAALQSVSVSGGATRQLNIPLETTASQASTGLIMVNSNTNCPAGSPAHTNCAQYTLVVPASNPSVGVFSSLGFSFAAPASGDVLFTVDALAAAPSSGGTADCTPPEQMTSKDANNMPLKATAAMTTNVARIDFSGCS